MTRMPRPSRPSGWRRPTATWSRCTRSTSSCPAGQSVALIGHNGSGKSTFLRMVAGLLDPTDGVVEVAGWPVGNVEARATTSFLPDDPVLYDDLSVREHAEYVSRLHGGTAGTTTPRSSSSGSA